MKAIFKNDYTWKSGSSCPEGMIGCAPETINFKKGHSLVGLTLSLSSDKKQVVAYQGNYSITIPVENFTILSDNVGVNKTLESGAGKYKVNTSAKILKTNPNKKDEWGDFGTDVVGTLEVGDVIEIAKTGGGGRGIVMTPYLFFADGTYILGYDADKVDDSTPLTSKLTLLTRFTPQGFLQKHKTNLLIVGALVIGYFAYKKFNK